MRRLAVPYLLAVTLVVTLVAGCGGSSPQSPVPGRSASGSGAMSSRAAGGNLYLGIVESDANPLISDDVNAFAPFVLYRGGQYYLWTNASWGGIYLSTSTNGVDWTPRTKVSGLADTAKRPTVIFNEGLGKFEIWYWNNGNIYGFDSFERAVSSDGLVWTDKVSCSQYGSPHRPVYTQAGKGISTNGPSVVFYNPGSTLTEPDYANPFANKYVMYFDQKYDATTTEALALAVSVDGTRWGVATEATGVLTPTAGAWDSRSTGFATIFQADGLFHAYYGGSSTAGGSGQGIGYASSPDGVNWTKHPAPLLHASDGVEWRNYATGSPNAVFVNGALKLYYQGGIDRNTAFLGLAIISDYTAPVITLAQDGKANGTKVTLKGTIVEEESGVAAASLEVKDEDGNVTQTVDLLPSLSTGSFSVEVDLSVVATATAGTACVARPGRPGSGGSYNSPRRFGNGKGHHGNSGGNHGNGNGHHNGGSTPAGDGEQYNITATAADKAGNVAEPVTLTVTLGAQQGGNGGSCGGSNGGREGHNGGSVGGGNNGNHGNNNNGRNNNNNNNRPGNGGGNNNGRGSNSVGRGGR